MKKVIKGKLFSGLGRGEKFTSLGWVSDQITHKLGFNIYPGTVNLRLTDDKSIQVVRELRTLHGVVIEPPDPKACGGRAFHIIIEGRFKGAIVIPDITEYGDDTVEIVAPMNLRKMLGLKDGDELTVDVQIP